MRIVMPMRGRTAEFIRVNTVLRSFVLSKHHNANQARASIAHFQMLRLTILCASSYSAASSMKRKKLPLVRSTTVLLVRRDDRVAMAGDGQVTVGETV